MQIKIKVDGIEHKENMCFSNDKLDNLAFVEMWVEGDKTSYTISLNDLETIADAFNNYRWEEL